MVNSSGSVFLRYQSSAPSEVYSGRRNEGKTRRHPGCLNGFVRCSRARDGNATRCCKSERKCREILKAEPRRIQEEGG